MKDLFQIFDESIETMQKLIAEDNYAGSSSISTDLITISVMSDFQDGILIGEVLEGIFDQIGQLFFTYRLSVEVQKAVREQICEQLALVGKSYKNGDKEKLYEALRNIRTEATQFQFKCFKTIKPRPEFSPQGLRVSRRA